MNELTNNDISSSTSVTASLLITMSLIWPIKLLLRMTAQYKRSNDRRSWRQLGSAGIFRSPSYRVAGFVLANDMKIAGSRGRISVVSRASVIFWEKNWIDEEFPPPLLSKTLRLDFFLNSIVCLFLEIGISKTLLNSKSGQGYKTGEGFRYFVGFGRQSRSRVKFWWVASACSVS